MPGRDHYRKKAPSSPEQPLPKKRAFKLKDELRLAMTSEQVAEAQKLAVEFQERIELSNNR